VVSYIELSEGPDVPIDLRINQIYGGGSNSKALG
jgi:hypothetical protein